MNYGGGSERRFKRQTLSKDGDVVIVTGARSHYHAIRLEAKQIYNCKFGHFAHDDMIGIPFGSWIVSKLRKNHKNKAKNEEKSNDNSDNDTSSNHQNKNTNQHIGKKRKYPQLKHKSTAMQRYGEICLLRPSCELWTLALLHRTQISYDADKSLITFLLQIKPNDIIFESGTGSGSLSTSFARVISPFGQLFTFEFNEFRAEYARLDFKNLLIDNLITVIHRNVIQNGFPNKKELIQLISNILSVDKQKDVANKNVFQYTDSIGGSDKFDEFSWLAQQKMDSLQDWVLKLNALNKEFVSGVFLDLPKPWKVIKSAYNVLKYNGKICSFSPCIEQVQKTCEVLGMNGFVDIRTFEVLERDLLIKEHIFPALDLNTNNSIHTIRSRPKSKCKDENNTLEKMVTSRPVGKTFGHTGYLTFALKALA